MRILLIEDEERIASFIERGLKEQQYAVDIALDGKNGLYLAEINPYDLIILDLKLPDYDGLTLCKELRVEKINIPILMLTARSGITDRVTGLDAGADDYLTKPFAFEELLARIRALLRRQKSQLNTVLKIADLELDQLTHQVKRADKEIPLTGKEFALLEYLMIHSGQVITRTMISEHVWNEDFDSFTNVIDVYVNYVRNKIDKGFDKQLIHTIRGVGYVLKE